VPVYAPPFVLVENPPRPIELTLDTEDSSGGLRLRRSQNLHVAYALEPNTFWAICVWTDDRGELVDAAAWFAGASAVAEPISLVKQVWQRSKALAERWLSDWHLIAVRLGQISIEEFTGEYTDHPDDMSSCGEVVSFIVLIS
jgi:hypothetical protein